MQYKEDLYGAFLPVEEGSGSFNEEERLEHGALPLIYWYQASKRTLPWREDPTPYHVWLSEIMLQQTRVEAVIPYYYRFLERLPEIKDLAEVPEEELMKLWQGLGYYNRARNLKKAAQAAVSLYDGNLPDSYEKLLALPGIGPYTAGAVASIAMNLPEPAVDGNVLRVLSRLWASEEDIGSPTVRKKMEGMIRALLVSRKAGGNQTHGVNPGIYNLGLKEQGLKEQGDRGSIRDGQRIRPGVYEPALMEQGDNGSIPDGQGIRPGVYKQALMGQGDDGSIRDGLEIRPGVYNQALMELGAIVCIPNGAPHCDVCPWEGICLAHKNDLTDKIPYKAPKKSRRIEKLTVFLIRYRNRIFLRKRPAKGLLANLYELPNVTGWLSEEEAGKAAAEILDLPQKSFIFEVRPLRDGKHIFTHVEWQMKGYEIIIRTPQEEQQTEPASEGIAGRTSEAIAGRTSEAIAGQSSEGIAEPALEGIAEPALEGIAGQASEGIVGQALEGIAGQASEGIAGQASEGIVDPEKGAFYEISYIKEHLAIPSAFSCFRFRAEY